MATKSRTKTNHLGRTQPHLQPFETITRRHQTKEGKEDDEGGLPIVSLDYQEMNEAIMLRLMVGKD